MADQNNADQLLKEQFRRLILSGSSHPNWTLVKQLSVELGVRLARGDVVAIRSFRVWAAWALTNSGLGADINPVLNVMVDAAHAGEEEARVKTEAQEDVADFLKWRL